MQVSPHFTLAELTRSQTALRRGIANQPDPSHLLALHALATHVLEPIRAYFGPFTPTSCYRSAALNRTIGGARRSQHMLGEAADIKLPSVSNRELADWVTAHLEFDQLILEFYRPDAPHHGWVHVSYRTGQCRGEILSGRLVDGEITYAALPRLPDGSVIGRQTGLYKGYDRCN